MEIALNPILKKILETEHIESKSGETLPVFAQVSRKEGEFLHNLVKEVDPTVSLEIGLAYGISAMFICDGLTKRPDTKHICIDLAQLGEPWHGNGLNNLAKAGHEDIIEFYNEESQIALPRLEAEGREIDFAFIDGAHTFDHALVDFFYVDRLLKIGGVVAFDDCEFPSVRKLLRFILKNRNYSVIGHMQHDYTPKTSVARKALMGLANASPKVKRILKPEFLETNAEMNIKSRCIALRKEAGDTRGFDMADLGHVEF